jgi:hypothetical protein
MDYRIIGYRVQLRIYMGCYEVLYIQWTLFLVVYGNGLFCIMDRIHG